MTFGYGMPTLAFQAAATISMYCRGRLFSQHIFEESHLLFTSLSTDGHMTWGTTLQMVYTLIGQHLSRVFAILWRGRHNVLLLCFSIVIRSLGHDYLLRFGTALDVICSTGCQSTHHHCYKPVLKSKPGDWQRTVAVSHPEAVSHPLN